MSNSKQNGRRRHVHQFPRNILFYLATLGALTLSPLMASNSFWRTDNQLLQQTVNRVNLECTDGPCDCVSANQ